MVDTLVQLVQLHMARNPTADSVWLQMAWNPMADTLVQLVLLNRKKEYAKMCAYDIRKPMADTLEQFERCRWPGIPWRTPLCSW